MEGRTTISHFEILSQAGAGGMGVVYKAEDTRLRRPVALKVLPPELVADDERRRRFMREARVAAAVSHPNIAAIYEVGEDGDDVYLAMEYVEGQTLAAMLAAGGLAPESCLRIAIDIARALERAHAIGVVHRDIKPENVMVQPDGRAKVLDFGLAKFRQDQAAEAAEQAGSQIETRPAALTRQGTILGTSGYMAPEQARSEPLDGRADLFSLGVVLHEALAGEHPFRGGTEIEIISAILKDRPAAVSSINRQVSPGLSSIVQRLLEKKPDDRYPSAAAVLADLEAQRSAAAGVVAGSAAVAPGSDAGRRPSSASGDRVGSSIAVLPFLDMSAQRDQEFFCEGMAEEIINALGSIAGLQVAARSSSFQFGGRDVDTRKAGETLGVDTVLEGSVRKAGERLRVTARLVQAADGYQLWSERFDREMADIFDLQDEITAKIVTALKVELGVAATPAVVRHTDDIDAYNLYLEGRHCWFRRHKGGLQRALRCFEGALEKDPSYVLPLVGLADVHNILGVYGFIDGDVAYRQASEAVGRAFEVGTEVSEAWAARAFTTYCLDARPLDALPQFERAVELDPRNGLAESWHAIALNSLGRFDEARRRVERSIEIEPLSTYAHSIGALIDLCSGDYEGAVERSNRGLEIDPELAIALWVAGTAHAQLGRFDVGASMVRRLVAVSDRAPIYVSLLGFIEARGGRSDEAEALLEELERRSAGEYIPPAALATLLVGLGRPDEAYATLMGCGRHHRGWMLIGPGMPQFDLLRAPKYSALWEQAGLLWAEGMTVPTVDPPARPSPDGAE